VTARPARTALVVTAAVLVGVPIDAGAGPSEGRTYVPAGAELDWLVLRAPTPAEQLGVIAAAELERVRAAARGEPAAPQPPLAGPEPAERPGASWPGEPLAGAARGQAPLGVRRVDGECECATPIGDASAERIAALYAQTTFTAGDEIAGVRLLHLRARYSDGIAIYINGREVARRGLARDGGALVLAPLASGPEWESFYIAAAGLLRRGENRLAVEVRPSSIGRSPVLDLELEARTGARIVRGPVVEWSGPSGAAISFDTDLPARAQVEYGVGRARLSTVSSAGGGLAVHHRVELRGLPAAAPVRYRVAAGGDVTPERVFHTAPSPGSVVRFAVYGDMRDGHDVHARIAESLLAESPDFVLVTGDLVVRGSDEGAWQRFFQVAGELLAQVPYYPVVGNHDVGRAGEEQRRMGEMFGVVPPVPGRPDWAHWYSFDVAGLHFAILDSNAYGDPAQLAWLRADLEAARRSGARALFAAVHDGPYSRGLHGGNQVARESYAPVLAAQGVVLLFAGHDHLYQRGEVDGLRYIVTGGGGAPLYPVRCGVRGTPRCSVRDGAAIALSEHHYIVVTVQRDYVQVCPKRPDRTPLERCTRYPLSARRR